MRSTKAVGIRRNALQWDLVLTQPDRLFLLRVIRLSGLPPPTRPNVISMDSMSTIVCPQCLKASGRILPFTSHEAFVNYVRCAECAYVWTIEKGPARPTIAPRPVRRT